MKLCRAELRAFSLPLVKTLPTAHGQIEGRRGHLVVLTDAQGHHGYGEATPLVEFGTEDLSASHAALARSVSDLLHAEEQGLEAFLILNTRACRDAPCARAAIDSALHDLAAQCLETDLASWIRERAGLGGAPASRVQVQAIVSGNDPSSVQASAASLLADGFETFKLKLATVGNVVDSGLDRERVAALREAIGPSLQIRLDANEAWTFREALSAISELASFGIDFIEQPVARRDLVALKDLDEHAAIPIAADEALLDSGWEACLKMRAASTFVVKPAAIGGIAPSLALFKRAEDQGIQIVWSSLIDGVVSRATALALAAALGSPEESHGLGTARLLASDLAEEGISKGPSVSLTLGPGLDWPRSHRRAPEDEIWGRLDSFEAPS
ncbi:MAG: o-succinylbenzoate synthase [Myxococcota bacterium]